MQQTRDKLYSPDFMSFIEMLSVRSGTIPEDGYRLATLTSCTVHLSSGRGRQQ
jgi:hypothetical protein